MPHLEKTIETVYETSANCLTFRLTDAEMLPTGKFRVGGNLQLHTNKAAQETGKKIVDNFVFSYEIEGDEFLTAAMAIFGKITESVKVVDPETGEEVETNLLRGNVGEVGFQDAVLVP